MAEKPDTIPMDRDQNHQNPYNPTARSAVQPNASKLGGGHGVAWIRRGKDGQFQMKLDGANKNTEWTTIPVPNDVKDKEAMTQAVQWALTHDMTVKLVDPER